MTQEKQLLLQDLCARLPYGVHCAVYTMSGDIRIEDDIIYYVAGPNVITFKGNDNNECFMYWQIKPYLRPMSSMTEEERNSVENWNWNIGSKDTEDALNYFDWLNRHHFDYRGLIEKGLAIEAPEGMYNFNED